MNIESVKKVIFTIGKNGIPVTPILWGTHGIGKTESVEQVAIDLGYKCITVMLSQIESVDLLGVMFSKKAVVSGHDVTNYVPPEWFDEALSTGKVILHLDEFNRARPDVMKAAFQLVLSRTLNNQKLPSSVVIVVSCNPSDENDGATGNVYDVNAMEDALLDRFMHLRVEYDYNLWMNWATRTDKDGNLNVDSDITSFLKLNPSSATSEQKTFELPKIKHGGRSWKRASELYSVWKKQQDFKTAEKYESLTKSEILECIAGAVGEDIALSFFKFLETSNKPFTLAEILEMSSDTEQKIKTYGNTSKNGENSARLDVLEETIVNILGEINSDPLKLQGKEDNLIKFYNLLPNDKFYGAMRRFMTVSDGIREGFKTGKVHLETMEISNKVLKMFQSDEEISKKLDQLTKLTQSEDKASKATKKTGAKSKVAEVA